MTNKVLLILIIASIILAVMIVFSFVSEEEFSKAYQKAEPKLIEPTLTNLWLWSMRIPMIVLLFIFSIGGFIFYFISRRKSKKTI